MLTVAALIARADLNLRLLAGRDGLDAEITWAHTCDLPDPWNWVETGQALLTNGIALPPQGEAQADVAEQLARRGISALGIAEDTGAPPLTPALLRECDRTGLPLFTIPFPLPFVAVAQAVSHAAMADQEQRLRTTAGLYDLVSREVDPHVGPGLAPFLRAVETLVGRRIALIDRRCGHSWEQDLVLPEWARDAHPPATATPPTTVPPPTTALSPAEPSPTTSPSRTTGHDQEDALPTVAPGRDRIGGRPRPGRSRAALWESADGSLIDALPIPAVPECMALFHPDPDELEPATTSSRTRGPRTRSGSDILLHATGVIGAVLSRMQADRVQENRREVEVVDRILDPSEPLTSSSGQGLRYLGYGVSVRGGVLDGASVRVQERSVTRLQRHGVRLSATIRGARHLLVLEDLPEEDIRPVLQHCVDGSVRVGLGERCDPAAVHTSVHQAIWALSAGTVSEQDGGPVVSTFSPVRDWMGFRTPDEARSFVESVLGPLLRGGGMHEDLLLTLRTYLAHARSPQRTAEALVLHRQTVGQRLRRIESLLGRELADTGTLARIWLALGLLDATAIDGPPRSS